MKKTLIFLLGALIATVLPGNGLNAQTRQVVLTVNTLDRAALQSAAIYANPTPGQQFFVDAAHLDPSWNGIATAVSSLSVFENLTISTDGFHVEGMVDGSTYAESFIVVRDTNDACYVYGISSPADRQVGIFSSGNIFASGNLTATLTVADNMLLPLSSVVVDLTGYGYSSLQRAVNACPSNTVLTFEDAVNVDNTVTIGRNLTINQAGYPLNSSITDASPVIRVSGANVTWKGGAGSVDITMPANAGSIFSLRNASLNLLHYSANAATNVALVGENAALNLNNSTLGSSSPTAAAILMTDNGIVNIDTAIFTACKYGVMMTSSSTGNLHIQEASAVSGMAACETAVSADAYRKANGYRDYRYSLASVLANVAADDTVVLVRNASATTPVAIATPVVLELDGNTVDGNLSLNNTTGTVVLRNGNVKNISSLASAVGDVRVEGLDSVATFNVGDHNVVIDGGRYVQVAPATGAHVLINGGKFTQPLLEGYLAADCHMIANTESDAAYFPYVVKRGFRVAFRNFNGKGNFIGLTPNDSVAVISTADNRISPAPSRPGYVSADSIFVAYWVDAAYTTPWQFLVDQLTQDTVLYAQWITDYNPATQFKYNVEYKRQQLDGTYELVYSYSGVVDQNGSVKVPVRNYIGYYCTNSGILNDSLNVQISYDNQAVSVWYNLQSYQLTWDLNGGHVTSGSLVSPASYRYSEPIVYPTNVRRDGHSLTWTPAPETMPASDLTITANYTPNDYYLTWEHADTTVTYTSNPINVVRAYFINDDNQPVDANLTYTLGSTNVTAPVAAGNYTISAATPDNNYHLAGTVTAGMTVNPATVSVNAPLVTTVKVYDGTTDANVENQGTVSPLGNDDLGVHTTASYATADPGENIVITAYFTLTGNDAPNYTLDAASGVVSTTGVILPQMVMRNDTLDNGIDANASGYCGGDAAGIDYYLLSGNPDQYKLVFSAAAIAAGFPSAGVDWTNITTPGHIDIDVPVNTMIGDYTVDLYLRNSAYAQFESAAIPVTFHVNLSKNSIRPIFTDVITIVDTCNCFEQATIQWDHKPAGATAWTMNVGSGPYYQDPSGALNGEYRVRVKMNGSLLTSCPQDDVTTFIVDNAPTQTKVSVYPNPVVDEVRVKIENPTQLTHMVEVMNVMGVTVYNGSFTGDEVSIDFSRFVNGSYTVSIDGIVNRVIKK